MKTYKFGVDFNSEGGALTLDVLVLGKEAKVGQVNTYTNDSGWTITAVLHNDWYNWYHWVNAFKATHPTLGTVEGNFEDTVTASSQEAFDHFWKHHEPEAWDYWDI